MKDLIILLFVFFILLIIWVQSNVQIYDLKFKGELQGNTEYNTNDIVLIESKLCLVKEVNNNAYSTVAACEQCAVTDSMCYKVYCNNNNFIKIFK